MSKFKMGQTVFFMKDNKPTSNPITGVVTVEGQVKLEYSPEIKVEDGKKQVVYMFSRYDSVLEQDVFRSESMLKRSLFKKQ